MFRSLRCCVQWALLVAFASCLFTIVITLLFSHARIFTSVAKFDDVSRRWLGLVVHGSRVVVRHKSNGSVGGMYCNDMTSPAIAADKTMLSQNVSLVLLGKLPRKIHGSPQHVADQFDTAVHSLSLSRDVNQTLFHSRKLVIWSTDHHPAPAYDAKYLLQPLGVRFLQHDLSPYNYCSLFQLCEERKSLKVSYKCVVITDFDIMVYACDRYICSLLWHLYLGNMLRQIPEGNQPCCNYSGEKIAQLADFWMYAGCIIPTLWYFSL